GACADAPPSARGRCPGGRSISWLFRDLHHDVALHDGLATQPRVKGEAFRGVQSVLLVRLHGREMALPFPHDHVAGGAGAGAAAVVLEVDVGGGGDVQHRARLAVIGQGVLLVVHLHRHVLGEERHLVLRHQEDSRIRSARLEASAPLRAASIMASASRSVALFTAVVRLWMSSRSSPPRASRRAATAARMRSSSPGSASCAPWASARSTWLITLSASVLASIKSRAATSASACSKDSSTMRSTSASVRP